MPVSASFRATAACYNASVQRSLSHFLHFTALPLLGLATIWGTEVASADTPCPADTTIHHKEDSNAREGSYTETSCKTAEGKSLGPVVRLSPDGVLLYEANYGHEGLEGVSLRFNLQGQLLAQEYWHNNQLDGEALENYSDGVIKSRCNYTAGERNGLCEKFYANGVPKEKSNYQKGELHGLHYRFDGSGALLSEGRYDHGQKSGLWTTNTSLGELVESGHYDKDRKTGEWNEVANGQRISAHYLAGLRQGERKVFKNSVLIRTEQWQQGTRVSVTPSQTRPWYPLALGIELGVTFGSDTVIENRVHLLFIPGSGKESTDGMSASGLQAGVGIEASRGVISARDQSRSTLGIMLRVGWSSAWVGDSKYAMPKYTLYTDMTPFFGNHTNGDAPRVDVYGVRFGLGISSLGWSSVVLDSFGGSEEDDKGLGQIVGLIFAALNHVELTGEIEKSSDRSDKDLRLGFTVGFGM